MNSSMLSSESIIQNDLNLAWGPGFRPTNVNRKVTALIAMNLKGLDFGGLEIGGLHEAII